jgi:HEAT repeat protein
MLVLLLLVAVPVLVPAAPVLAQGKRDKPVFDTDDVPAPTAEETRKRERDPIRAAIGRLAGWPSDRAKRAAELLIVQKEKSLKPIADVLISQRREEVRLKPGCAYVLGRIGDKSHATTLILVAAEKEQHRYAQVYLEAAFKLDPERTVKEAFRFFHLRTTTLRHQAVRFVRDHIHAKNKNDVLELLDKRSSPLPMTREIGLQLLDRLYQTGEVDWASISESIYRSLGDTSPQVARRAMQFCAARRDERDNENVKALNRLITREVSYWRERSYAALALATHSSAYRVQPFSDEAIKVLQGARGMQHPKELLAQGSAALALAQVALRTSDPKLVKLLDRDIPIVLIEAVGASNRHYRDFSTVMPLAYTMLRRITGKNFPDQAPIWAQWWRDHGHRFRAKRELIEVAETDIPTTVLDVRPPGGGSRDGIRLVVVGSVRPTYRYGQAFAIEESNMREVVEMLRGVDFFELPEADTAKVPADAALVVLRVGDLVRTVSFGSEGARIGARNRILAFLMQVGKEQQWQHFWDRDEYPNWDLFFAEINRWFHEHKDETERAARLRELIAASLDDTIDLNQRVRAVATLKSLPGGAKALSDGQLKALVSAVAAEPGTSEFVIDTTNFLVPAGGPKAALALVDVLASQVGPDARALLRHICASLPDTDKVVLSEDKRWQVRAAATRSLEDVEPHVSTKPLRARLKDESILVRVAAAEALARRKDTEVIPALAALAQDPKPSVRAAAAYAYGLLGGEDGLRGLEPLLFDDAEADVRRRAIEGLRAGKTEGAAELMLRVFEDELEPTVRAAAAGAVIEMESPALVDTLVQRLEVTDAGSNARVALVNVLARFQDARTAPLLRRILRGDDTSSKDAAALGLARRWDAVAVTQLIRMVQGRRHARAAVVHLELLTSQGFETEDYDELARNYSDWFKIKSTGRPAVWFRDALMERNHEVAVLNSFVALPKKGAPEAVPDVSDEAIPLLLRIMRSQDWYLARNASLVLARHIGKDAPPVLEYIRTPEEREDAIREFNIWWEKEEKRLEKEKRG